MCTVHFEDVKLNSIRLLDAHYLYVKINMRFKNYITSKK